MTFVLNRRAFHQSGAIYTKATYHKQKWCQAHAFTQLYFLQQKSRYKIKKHTL